MTQPIVRKLSPLQRKLHTIIFEADTPMGKLFDVVLLVFIVLSIIAVNVESVASIAGKYSDVLFYTEWILTIFFTLEYILRLYCSYKPMKYVFSLYGIIDLLAIVPSYIGIFFTGAHSLMIIRALRLLRVFRIFKMVGFMNQGTVIMSALRASRDKIFVFVFFIFLMVNIMGAIMYLVEGSANSGFDSIPRSIYWAIVTMTTVGYGDISPTTSLGQFLAAVVMIMGYAIIAVPTGIVSAELVKGDKESHEITTQTCMSCSLEGHDTDAEYCKYCGEHLELK